MPQTNRSKFFKVAHRGWHKVHLENTMEAFRAAYAAGCDMVEFDVQLSRDGVPVIFHDDDCKRLAGRGDFVFELDWSELRTLKMKARNGAVYLIPSLEQFLAEFGSRPFYLELKVPHAKAKDNVYLEKLGRLSAESVKRAAAHPETFLASFHSGILRMLRKADGYPRLAGIFESYPQFLGSFQEAEENPAKDDAQWPTDLLYYSVSDKIFRKYAKEVSAGRYAGGPSPEKILIWDIAGAEDFRTAIGQGVRGLVTDDVETLLRL